MADVTQTVKAKKVKAGDFLPGLGDGYVFEDPERNPDTVGTLVAGEDSVLITFHDAEGDENYVLIGKNVPVTVRREG